MNYQITTKSRTHLRNILKYFFAKGYSYASSEIKTAEQYDTYAEYWSQLLIYPEAKMLGGNNHKVSDYELVTFEQFLALNEPVIEKLDIVSGSETYNVIVSKEVIKFGCQTFTHSEFDKLTAAVKKVRESVK